MSFLLFIIFLPFFGSILSGFFGFFFGSLGSVIISTTSLFFTFLFSLLNFYNTLSNGHVFLIKLTPWISSGIFECSWAFYFDTLTNVMLIVITSISFLVHLYSSEYMSQDPHLSRFMSFLSLFTFFMILLVTADNFIQMFVGWEGVGFCSFLLINFWFTRLQANKAAIKAMLVNRVSDFLLILGILILFRYLKSVEYFSLFASISLLENYYTYFLNFEISIIDLICFLIIFGAMGKSAQLFFHVWLPDAMEGPTPVSALIHAATMVTAGVFLVVRCSPIFEYSNNALAFLILIGSLTAFYASSIGLVQNDLKKIIAYSTCSQLGYMFMACGFSNYSLAIFHLFNHAFFKALLFLSAGVVIHAMNDEQDIRKMGGLRRILPFTYSMFVIGSLALMGFPFLSGFYSKDAILETAYASYNLLGHFAYWLGTLAACCTAFYSTRLIYFTFLGPTNAHKQVILYAHEPAPAMAIPLGALALGAIFIGYFTRDMFIGLGSNFFGNAIFVHPSHNLMIDAEFIPIFFKILPVCLSLLSMFLALYLYIYKFEFFYLKKISIFGIYFYNFLNRKWYFDKFYNEFISQNIINTGYFYTYQIVDKGLLELIGPLGILNSIEKNSRKLMLLQTGYIFHYSMIFVLSIFLLFLINFNLFSLNLSIFILFFIIFFIIK